VPNFLIERDRESFGARAVRWRRERGLGIMIIALTNEEES
jgi:hypothetical protein